MAPISRNLSAPRAIVKRFLAGPDSDELSVLQAARPVVSAGSGQKSLDTGVLLAYLARQTKERFTMHTHLGRQYGYWYYYFRTGLPGVR
jgi:hypothetical protein